MTDDTKGRLLGLTLFGILALWITTGTISGLSSSIRSTRWPKVPARIVASAVYIGRANAATRWVPEVEYEYVAGDKVYRSSRIRFLLSPFYKESAASDLIASYPVGRVTSVAYNPQAPGESVLEPGLPPGAAKQGFIALFFCSLAGYIFYEIRYPERRILLRSAPEAIQSDEEDQDDRGIEAA